MPTKNPPATQVVEVLLVEVLPQYEEYQSRTTRQIPIVVLDPRG